MKIALVHDWLTGMRGGERCLEAFLQLYPEADIFTLFHVPGSTSPRIDARVKATSWMQRIPGIAHLYKFLLPLYPLAIRSLNLSGYDLVISLSHAAAKNVHPRGARHICYCFSPMRYIWDQTPEYVGKFGAALAAPLVFLLRRWDVRGAQGVADFCAISELVAARIRAYYGRKSIVIFPPTDTGWIAPYGNEYTPGEAFLLAGALVRYKHPERVVQVCSKLQLPLWVVGTGPLEQRLRSIAGPSVTFFGRLSDTDLADRYRRCRALIHAGVEDFGLVPVECLAAGRPVIGKGQGGLTNTVQGVFPSDNAPPPDSTGVFFKALDGMREEQALEHALQYFITHEHTFLPSSCVNRSREFSFELFKTRWFAAYT